MARQRGDSNDDDDERSDSDLSGEESDVEEEEEEDGEEEEEEDEAAEAKHKLVEADLAEIKSMVAEMDKIKIRLQFRLAREQSGWGLASPSSSRRRSSVEEIFVPPTVAAAVQTTWDMPRMYEVEKLISSSGNAPSKGEDREASPPIAPSVQLNMEDLAKSYGIDDAVFATKPQLSPIRQNSRKPSAMEEQQHASPQPTRQASMRPASSIWDALIVGGSAASDQSQGSLVSEDKPPKLNRSQLIPESESGERPASPVESSVAMLEDSFGAPASPTRSDVFAASASARAAQENEQGKTMEQKEMEAMKNLLFF